MKFGKTEITKHLILRETGSECSVLVIFVLQIGSMEELWSKGNKLLALEMLKDTHCDNSELLMSSEAASLI